jgi:arylsulfatase A-like enzyme
VAGFLDLGLVIINNSLIGRTFYRLSGDFAWLIPSGVTALVLVPGILVSLYVKARGPAVSAGMAEGLLFFVGFLDVCARLPLHIWASLLICGGLATQSVRLMSRRRLGFLRVVRWTVIPLAGSVLVIVAVTIGERAWSEHHAMSALAPAPPGGRNVLLIVWDTVRAGNLSLYGYNRPTTPNLERLAGRGVRFDLAFSTSPWTLPTHASLFTGKWPHQLDVGWKSPLRDKVPTLAEYLASQGYDTAGFVANLEYCTRETGLARGFAHYEDFPFDVFDIFNRYVGLTSRLEITSWALSFDWLLEKCLGHWYDLTPHSREHVKNAAAVNRSFLEWLARRQTPRRPFFAFLNLIDAHTPYEVPDRSTAPFGLRPSSSLDRQAMFQWAMLDKARLSVHDVRMAADVYDDCIFYLDRQLGTLLQELSQRGVLENTLVIVTADHGEHLGDHLLFFHGCSLYRQLVQVPLVIVNNQVVPTNRVVAEPASLCDVSATVVDLLGLGADAPFPGQSLARFWAHSGREDTQPEEPLLMETDKPELLTNQGREPAAKGPMKSLIARGMHYIRTADGLEELYMLNIDPEERFNLAGSIRFGEALRKFRDMLAAMRERE